MISHNLPSHNLTIYHPTIYNHTIYHHQSLISHNLPSLSSSSISHLSQSHNLIINLSHHLPSYLIYHLIIKSVSQSTISSNHIVIGTLSRITSQFEKSRKVSGPRALRPSQVYLLKIDWWLIRNGEMVDDWWLMWDSWLMMVDGIDGWWLMVDGW